MEGLHTPGFGMARRIGAGLAAAALAASLSGCTPPWEHQSAPATPPATVPASPAPSPAWHSQQPASLDFTAGGPDFQYQTSGQPGFKFLVTGGTTQGLNGNGALAVTEWAPGDVPGAWQMISTDVYATPGNTAPIQVVRITADGVVITRQGGHLGMTDLKKLIPADNPNPAAPAGGSTAGG